MKKLKRKLYKIYFIVSEFFASFFGEGKVESVGAESKIDYTKFKKADPSKIFFGFWTEVFEKAKKENRPVYTLAPMADVTDQAFRYMLNKYGKPDVTWTEFVSANGLMSPGREVLQKDLEYNEIERPIVAQLFTADPENMRGAAKLCAELGFEGIDLNFGCPAGIIVKQGAGSKIITTPNIAQEVIRAAQEGAGNLPVSVKTRIGYNKVEIEEWLPKILECNIPVLTVHLRTKKEMSLVPAHYEYIDRIHKLVKEISPATKLIINGDIKSIQHADELYKKYKFDGAMIGRAVFGTPWFFNRETKYYSLEEKLKIMLEHTKLFEEKLIQVKPFALMKKHYKAYVNGFDGAKDLRNRLFDTKNYEEVEQIVSRFLEDRKA